MTAAKLGAAALVLGSGGGAIGDSLGMVPPPPLPPPLADTPTLAGVERPARKPPPLPDVLTGALTLMVSPACMQK